MELHKVGVRTDFDYSLKLKLNNTIQIPTQGYF